MDTLTITTLCTTTVFFVLFILFVILYIKKSADYKKIYNRFKDIVDIERETEKAQKQYNKLILEYKEKEKALLQKEQKLKQAYSSKREIYDKLEYLTELDLTSIEGMMID